MSTLLLATRNPDKIAEIREILIDLPVRVTTLLDFPSFPGIVENGKTFDENALKKARIAFEHTHLPSLGDDSGLEVFYLNGKPGVFSARYSGEQTTYEANNKKLLRALLGTMPEQRKAQFRCVVAFVAEGIERTAEGICPGTITVKPRGKAGFGYDPVFIPDGHSNTFAELPSDVKNSISHRGRALMQIKKTVVDYFTSR